MQASSCTCSAGCETSGAGAERTAWVKAARGCTCKRWAHCPSSPSGWPASAGGVAAGMSLSSSSSTMRWLRCARGLWVCTTMPGAACRQQLAARVRSPSISTTQARQLPAGLSGSAWHKCGTSAPWRVASCHRVSPASASTVRPLSVSVMGVACVMACVAA